MDKDFLEYFNNFLNENSNEIVITNSNRIVINGKDIGLLTYHLINKTSIEVDKLYIDQAYQRIGIGTRLIKWLFDTHVNVKKIVVYPLSKTEAFWLKYATVVDDEGNITINRETFFSKV